MKKVGAIILAAVAIVLGVQQVPDEPTKTAATVTISGTDRQLLVAVAYAPSGDRAVASVVCDAESLTKTGSTGNVCGNLQIELWTKTAPAEGVDLPLTITMSDDCAAAAMAVNLTDVDQTTPIAGMRIAVGDSVQSSSADKDGGDATLILVFSDDKSETISTPTGFVEKGNEAGDLIFRAAGFLDDDASEDSAQLNFSGSVYYAAFIVGVNLAP